MLTREQIEEIQSESREKGVSINPGHIQDCHLHRTRGKIHSPEPSRRAASENWMDIELRTVNGTDMRIQGGLTPAMVYTILKSL